MGNGFDIRELLSDVDLSVESRDGSKISQDSDVFLSS
jgi:hypothetical protein